MSAEKSTQTEQPWMFPDHPEGHYGVTLKSAIKGQADKLGTDLISRGHVGFLRTARTILKGRQDIDQIHGFDIKRTEEREYTFSHQDPGNRSQTSIEGRVRVEFGDHIENSEIILVDLRAQQAGV